MATPKPEELQKVDFSVPDKDWTETKPDFRPGTWCYSGKPSVVEYLGLPHARKWSPADEDWDLPDGWKQTILEGIRERLLKYRSFHVFMDICVRCGACADKCHFYLGSGDPKNMPVLRAELLRSIYRREFTTAGKIFKQMAGGRELTEEVIKEWFSYFYQCTECRRCSVFCPYGIDTAEITMMGRELLHLIGVNTNWILEPVSNCYRIGNHLGIQPHAFKDSVEGLVEDVEMETGIKVNPSFNRKGAEILFITPSADAFAMPAIFTMMGYMMLFHYLDLDVTFSTYASEGGNFGLFTSHEMQKRLNFKMYHEAKRLGVKWILGGECGHMWRVIHQYMGTHWGGCDELEVPVSPATGTRFDHAKFTKMIHITEFTADLIKNDKLKLKPERNDGYNITYHDSCNPARGMGLLEEPRYIIDKVANNFYEMPENTIREQTFCCGSGTGLNTDEFMEMRMRGGFPRASALKHVAKKHDVNLMATICAIDKATLDALVKYWIPEVEIGGVHELVGNALVMEGENERETNLRGEPIPMPPSESPPEAVSGEAGEGEGEANV
jgi:Fe-S oxidoreductase